MLLFRRSQPRPPGPVFTSAGARPLVASAARVQLGDRTEAERARRLRQAWQGEAWAYRDAIGEIRYPTEFMANALTRMRIYPALQGAPDEPPAKLDEAEGVPDSLVNAALDLLRALGAGQSGLRPILSTQYVNNKIAGEMYLVGWVDADTGEETWQIRSMDEVILDDAGDVWIRDDPTAQVGQPELRRLDRDGSYVARLWTPHKRWRGLADSPMRAVLDSCEELLLLSRTIRALARSRLGGNGLLIIARELSLHGINSTDDDDEESDPFFDELTRAMLTPISEEGDASSVVPLVARVPGEFIKDGKAAQLIRFDRDLDGKAMELRGELIDRIATGLDLPKEVVTGAADLNHWTAWQVDDNTFRHHIEPDVIGQVDGLTAAYLQPRLAAYNLWDPQLIRRVCFWYDPVELVTHPDRGNDAKLAFDAGAVGRATLRTATGFTDDDKPDELDEALHVIDHSRGAPPEVVAALVEAVAPGLAAKIRQAVSDLGDVPAEDTSTPPAGPGPAPAAPPPAEQAPPATPGAEAPEQRPTTAAGGTVDEVQRRGVMVAFYPTAEQASALAIADGEAAEEIHCTLAYLGHAEDLTDDQITAIHTTAADLASRHGAMTGEFGGIGRFTHDGSPDGDPVYASVDVPGLAALRTRLVEALRDAGAEHASDHGFTPHATLAYIPGDAPMPDHRLEPVPCEFSALSVVVGPDRTDYPMTGAEPLVAAAPARRIHANTSRALLDIDRQLRARLLTATDSAVRRQLERAGARLRSRAQHDQRLRAELTGVAQDRVAATLGRDRVAAFGVADGELLDTDWADLRALWDSWVRRAQARARRTAANIVGVDAATDAVRDLEVSQDTARDLGWGVLAAGLSALLAARLYDPHPDAPPAGEYDPNLTVPPALVRDALATAGADPTVAALDGGQAVVDLPSGAWGVGQGSAVQSFLEANGAERESYTWVHGDTERPLDAHLDLDGVEFTDWTDARLANNDTFPEVDVLAPGDHDGCTCDAWITWATGGTELPVAASG